MLRKYNQIALPGKEEYYWNIRTHAHKIENVLKIIGNEVDWTSWYRPYWYNKLIGGAERSSHIYGNGCDGVHRKMSSNKVREKLYPKLEELGLRMELDDTYHFHLDGMLHYSKELGFYARPPNIKFASQ